MSCGSNINIPEKTIPISEKERWNNAITIMQKLLETSSGLGLTDVQAAGILGNIYVESRWNPTNINHNDKGSKSIGLCQWHLDRIPKLLDFAKDCGKSWQDLNTQIGYLIKELKTDEKNALYALKKTTNVESAANTFCKTFERPQVCQGRVDPAKQVLQKWRERNK